MLRGYIIMDWFGSNFSTLKYHEYKKILVKLYIQYYEAYWKHKNKALHNEKIQRKQITEWFEKEKWNALTSEYP